MIISKLLVVPLVWFVLLEVLVLEILVHLVLVLLDILVLYVLVRLVLVFHLGNSVIFHF